MANRQIKNTNPGGLGTYIGKDEQREHVFFPGGATTAVDEKKLAEACKDPAFSVHFDTGLLVDVTPTAKAAPVKAEETKPAEPVAPASATKKDDAKK